MKRNGVLERALRCMFGWTYSGVSLAGVLLLASGVRANTVIVQDTFLFTGDLEYVPGIFPDTVNLPGGAWVCEAQWNWSRPYIPGNQRAWDWPTNAVAMGEEKVCIAIPLTGYNTGKLRISATLAMPADRLTSEGVGLGFKPAIPYTGYTNLNYDTEIKTDFTGLRVNGSGVITLIVNGVAQSSATLSVGELEGKQFYPLSYDIDTASGDLFNIQFNGQYLGDLSSTAFTEEATANAVFFVFAGSRGYVDNVTVTAIEGTVAPTVNNAYGATGVRGTQATLNGILLSGNAADVTVYWGPDPENWAHTNSLGTLSDGMFSTTVAGLDLSTTYYYRCYATNTEGSAWADETASFLSAAQSFTWTGTGGDAYWTTAENWTPDVRFPDLPRETVCFSNGNNTVFLNQPTVTIGGLSMAPNDWSGYGFVITTNAPGQRLVFDYTDGPAFIRMLDNRWANSTLAAPVVLSNDVEVSTVTRSAAYGLVFRGPIAGPGRLVAKNGLIVLDPLEDTTYDITFSGTKSSGYLTKKGTKTATLTGTNSIALAGGWDDNTGVSIGGGTLVLSGGIFTNQTATTRGVFFRDSGNAVIVTNGCRLINARSGNHAYFNKPGNAIVITGAGSEWNLQGDYVVSDANSNRLSFADGAHITSVQAKIGWDGGSYNSLDVTGASTLWTVGGVIGVGRNTVSNTLTIASGAVVENTWVWVGGYIYYEDGGGTGNGLVISDGGVLNSGRDEGWGWGSCVGVSGVSGGRVDANYALVTGTNSTWNLLNRPLHIGYVTASGATGVWNRVTVEAGGVLTNVNALYVGCTANGGASASNELRVAAGGAAYATSVTVGEAASLGNRLTLAGGALHTGALTLNAGNLLNPVIGTTGVVPMVVSGTAVLSNGSYLSISLPDGLQPGTYTVLTASSVDDQGVEWDPAFHAVGWSFAVVDGTRLDVTYKNPGTRVMLF